MQVIPATRQAEAEDEGTGDPIRASGPRDDPYIVADREGQSHHRRKEGRGSGEGGVTVCLATEE